MHRRVSVCNLWKGFAQRFPSKFCGQIHFFFSFKRFLDSPYLMPFNPAELNIKILLLDLFSRLEIQSVQRCDSTESPASSLILSKSTSGKHCPWGSCTLIIMLNGTPDSRHNRLKFVPFAFNCASVSDWLKSEICPVVLLVNSSMTLFFKDG